MIKCAYISPHRDGTGWAKAAQGYIKALNRVGVDVVIRPVKMTPTSEEIDQELLSLENKDTDDVDVVIQHNLPGEFVYKGGLLNIGMFAYETNCAPWSGWSSKIEMMDTIVNFCKSDGRMTMKTSPNFSGKLAICPHAIDIDKFDLPYEDLSFGLPRNTYKFYTVGEWNRRKNITATIVAYLSEFSSSDNVALILKVSGDHSGIAKQIEATKEQLGRFKNTNHYPPVVLIPNRLSDDQIGSIHHSCDCYVNSSYGESFCLPAFDAFGFGNKAIVPNHSVFSEYPVVFPKRIKSHTTMAFGVPNNYNLYSTDEKWESVDIIHLRELMRYEYTHTTGVKESYKNIHILDDNFSYQKIGKVLREIIEG